MLEENRWHRIENENEVFSPSLLVYPDRIDKNISGMIRMAGDASRLRPHVKTYKMEEVVKMQLDNGISRFKCATISEAEMTARAGASDILLALQPVGPNIERFFRLQQAYKNVRFSCIADSGQIIRQISELASRYDIDTHIWLDINVGMDRTGISPGAEAISLYKFTDTLPKLKAEGLHVYDGHIHEKDYSLRQKICNESFAPALKMREDLESEGLGQVKIVAGGTPTFPVHALRKDVELSPGTLLLWDYGYSSSFADMDFLHAAVLFTRVVSKPARDLICLDLGHKAVSSEMPQPRIMIPGMDDLKITGHNEEHMVIRTRHAENYKTGDTVYAIPWHICPTVDRYDRVNVVTGSRVTGQWIVEARRRQITY
jgi:D-serine deaminase-like pyridoxal phosphate-dependent protein